MSDPYASSNPVSGGDPNYGGGQYGMPPPAPGGPYSNAPISSDPYGSPPPVSGPPQGPPPGYPPAAPSYPPGPAGYGPPPGYPQAGPPPGFGGAMYGVDPVTGLPFSDKTKLVAGLLQLLVGGFGAGRFYTGHTGMAIGQIAVTWLTCGLGAIWPLIDGIMILVNGGTDAQGRRLRDS